MAANGKTAKGGDIPATIMRSEKHAQDIWSETHDTPSRRMARAGVPTWLLSRH